MRHWVVAQLQTARLGPVIVLDPQDAARTEEVEHALAATRVVDATDWWSLRQGWERHGRHAGAERIAFVVTDPNVNTERDLPWDISEAAHCLRVRVPGDPDIRPMLLELPDTDSDAVSALLHRKPLASATDILGVVVGIWPLDDADRSDRIRVALRLLGRQEPSRLLAYARAHLSDDPVVAGVLADPPNLMPLQELWDAWVSDPSNTELTNMFEACRSEMADLFLGGILRPVLSATSSLPPWAMAGTRESTPHERVRSLLAAQPEVPGPETSLEAWLPLAMWWGNIRNELAQVVPADSELSATAWARWDVIDVAFLAWVRTSYGGQLTRSWAGGPTSLDRVQPYLANRAHAAGKVLLLVFDGMGFAVWSQIRQGARLHVTHSSGTLAMLPTLTEISRQAIAAGTPPIGFADTLLTLQKERERWQTAWDDSGMSCTWLRIDGEPVDIEKVPLGDYDIIGLVISATDKQMHSADLMGDAMLHSAMATWLRSGFLDDLLARATNLGYETWVTADHGSLECLPERGENEGEYVKRQGTRHRRYANRTLRDAATAEGVVLDVIPGLPTDYAERLLFAQGRTSWKHARITHGGLSMDEVIVPFARIEAP